MLDSTPKSPIESQRCMSKHSQSSSSAHAIDEVTRITADPFAKAQNSAGFEGIFRSPGTKVL